MEEGGAVRFPRLMVPVAKHLFAGTYVVLAAAVVAPPARAEADGPDHFRVVGVAQTSVLNVRAGPSASAARVGTLPADARGLRNLGCEGGLSYGEWANASAEERAAGRRDRWCRIDYDGLVGWVAGWHLAEDTAPAEAQVDDGPSFDCARAESSADKLVCQDDQLAALDRETARLFRLARGGPHMTPERRPELVAYQRGWIKGRDDCWKAEDLRACVLDAYVIRIHELRQGYADARKQDDAGISKGPLVADCDDFGALIGITFVEGDPPLAALEWQDRLLVLNLGPTGSGARYTAQAFDGDYVFWVKGNQASFEVPERRTFGCRIEEPG